MRLVDFYKKNKIIPTVNIGDVTIDKILKQRSNFFHSIHINDFKNKTVLELAPGTGVNAYFLLSKGIKKIVLVDMNPYSISQIKKNLKKFKNKEIIMDDMYKYNTKEKFDIVIAECVLHAMEFPNKILKKLPTYLKKNGILIFTITDEFAYLSEKLRGYISKILIIEKEKKDQFQLSFKQKTQYLSNIFKKHLAKLGTNTKKTEKWVQDNMMQYDFWGKKRHLSLESAISSLNLKKNNLCFWSISPNISYNFLWYKNRSTKIVNQNISKNYKINKLNFLDVRQKYNLEKLSNLKIFNSLEKLLIKLSNLIYKSSINENSLSKIEIFFNLGI